MKTNIVFLILLLLSVSSFSDVPQNNTENEKEEDSLKLDGPVVRLNNGFLRGKIMHTLRGKKIYSFLGIRYAHPPIEKLRFKAPKEWLEPWEGIKNAYSDGNKCPQLNFPERNYEGDEDCLYLNVYTTKLISDEENIEKEKQNVFVFLHGGGFSHGSGHSQEYGPQHLLENDLILVVPNFRIGVFGFLSMENEELPGNLGLLDQQLALQWVQKNIAAFGGDPNSVTLGGTNSGAISTHLHAMTPSSHGLFHRAIALSGNPLTSWGVIDPSEAKYRAKKLFDILGCKTKDETEGNSTEPSTKEILSCLSYTDVPKIIRKAQFVLELNTDFTFPFVPMIDIGNKDGIFLKKYPEEMLTDGQFADIPWMMGVTSLDGLPHSLHIMISHWVKEAFSENFEYSVPAFLGLRYRYESNIKKAGKLIQKFYELESNIGFHSLKNLGMMFTDAYYFSTLIETIKTYSSKNLSPIYAYHFSYNYRKARIAIGVPQGDDIGYLFPGTNSLLQWSLNDPEFEAVQKITSLISTFVNTGIPTDEKSNNFSWTPIMRDEIKFLDIDKIYKMIAEKDFYPERMAFWKDVESILLGDEDINQKDEL